MNRKAMQVNRKAMQTGLVRYAIRKILFILFSLFVIVLVVFVSLRIAQGDIAGLLLSYGWSEEGYAALRVKLGLNDPIYIQFGKYFWNVLHGDLGISYITHRSVVSELMHSFPLSLLLASIAQVIALGIGIPVGVISAQKRGSIIDNIIRVTVIGAVSVPVFWTGLLFIYIFCVVLRLFPTGGTGGLSHLVLPSVVLATFSLAGIVRMTRSTMLEVIRLDYIRTAKAKGLGERAVLYKHALRNALIPILTLSGVYLGVMIGGSVLTEYVFSWPGLGRLTIESIRSRDTPLITGCVLTICATFLLINLVIDMLYHYIDPRVKLR